MDIDQVRPPRLEGEGLVWHLSNVLASPFLGLARQVLARPVRVIPPQTGNTHA